MLYTEYKLAAEKHIKTCLGIAQAIDKLNALDNSALLVSSNKQATLHNMFYMCGYVLESISTYSVYKHYGWRPNRNVKTTDHHFSSICNFSFYPSDGYPYYVHEHKFQTNQFEVLKVPFGNTGVPLIDNSVSVDIDIQILFNIWKPEIRYHEANRNYPYLLNSHINFNETNILKFINFTNQIYNSLIQIVG
ncbi:hypothetical protein GCM10011514_45060 [Emticicia aquatilis]|uniref:Uncharacterized protein n=1 Tax=Emticicia aquatilis TaxID=1537369 RepID=A0A916Z4P5_9BACT|nr:hypothetical protein [Emticicia aquatilis]GGD76091.1 hypothetical protein GCM10011514_45060 [Emticicia aquatilis]